MKNYVKCFLRRGLIFGGFGPIICGIVFFVIELCGTTLGLSGSEILLAILSTYLIAFVQAGASIFNQIDSWPVAKSLGCHLGSIYLVYTLAYLVNAWIPFDPAVILVFTGIFLAVYFAVWLTVFAIVKATSRKMSSKIK